jgi:hypothetical protein
MILMLTVRYATSSGQARMRQLGEDNMDLIDAVKYGAAGIAGISIIVTAGLLQRELSRDEIRPEARKILVVFMGFALVTLLCCGGFAAYDSSQKSSGDADAKLHQIGSIASGMDASLLAKATADSAIENNPSLKRNLEVAIRSMCDDVGKIGAITGDPSLGSKCKQRSGVQ